MAAVAGITQDELVGGDDKAILRTRIELSPKVAALQELVKHLTLEAGKPTSRDEGQPHLLRDITDDRLLELMIPRRQQRQRLLEGKKR